VTAGHAGTPELRQSNTVNIKMEFRHPKYYKELRKLRNKLDQTISASGSYGLTKRVRSGPGPKPRYTPTGILLGVDLGDKPQAASSKPQAPSESSNKPQASSPKQQASSSKPQASSSKI